MSEIKQILSWVRIELILKDRRKFSHQGLEQEKEDKHEEIRDLRKQRADASYVDEYG